MDIRRDTLTPTVRIFSITTSNLLPSEVVVKLSKLREIDLLNEVVSRILIESLHWAVNVPDFASLEPEIKIASYQTCWFELFMLGFIQTEKDTRMSLVDVCCTLIKHLKETETDEIETLLSTIAPSGMLLQDFVSTVKLLDMDHIEYDVLRVMCLFGRNHDQFLANNVREAHLENLRAHLMEKYNDDTLTADRISKILHVVQKMQTINGDIVHALFFDHLLGQHNSSVIQTIPDMFKFLSTSKFSENYPQNGPTDDSNILS